MNKEEHNTCNTCISASLDCVFCFLWHKPVEPDNTCRLHAQGSDQQNGLRKEVRKECSKK